MTDSDSEAFENCMEAIATRAVQRHYAAHPQLEAAYGTNGRDKCLQDARYHLTYLQQAIVSQSPDLFLDYVVWAQTVLQGYNIPVQDLVDHLQLLAECARELLPAELGRQAGDYLQQAQARLGQEPPTPTSFLRPDAPHHDLASLYLEALLDGRRHDASTAILAAANDGVPVAELYLHVFQPCQREIGRLWQINRISVGQEHYCTAATQLIMSQLYPFIFNAERCGKRMVATCVGGELHEIGVRMVTDFFEMAGWDTFYLGANVPHGSIIAALKERQADVLGISVTISTHIGQVRDLIEAVRGDAETASTKILVGGYPFNIEPQLWASVGADGYGENAQSSVDIAARLLG